VILTSNLACVSPASATSIAITMVIKESPTASASASPIAVCSGATVNLTATAPTVKPTTLLSENFNAATNAWTKTNTSTGGTTAVAAWTLRPNGYNPGIIIISNNASQFYLSARNTTLLQIERLLKRRMQWKMSWQAKPIP
jgi:lipoprotein-anchoring transpeptidase ErfK/SrfK